MQREMVNRMRELESDPDYIFRRGKTHLFVTVHTSRRQKKANDVDFML